ncbi:hypothetical protein M5E88_08735 [Akkermansia muciniphila]|nr:hypothetical protein M5E88_08735 [Akkermansia muciniphila]
MGNTACYAYDPRGRKTAEYGTALQPSVFGYDDADRLVSLMTFRVPGKPSLPIRGNGRTGT